VTRRFTLHLADESPTIRRLVELTFADEPVALVSVGGGAAALEAITARPPDIVLADATLPAPDGYDVASFVKRTPELAHIPVILLTGAFQPVDPARAAESGCDAVLVKPLDPPELEWKVKHLLRDPAQQGAGDPTLEDRFDAIDAGLDAQARPVRTDSPGQTADHGDEPDFAAHAAEARCTSERGSVPLDAYFDEVDEECRQSGIRALKRAFHTLLDAARSRPSGGDEL
jgi:CheY-like chemotaxis protein